MATPSNGGGPPVDGNGLRPTPLVVGPTTANVAVVVAGPTIVDRVAPVVGPAIAGLAVAPMQLIANQHHQFAGGPAFDLEAGLLGSPPRKSNIGHHIHTRIPL